MLCLCGDVAFSFFVEVKFFGRFDNAIVKETEIGLAVGIGGSINVGFR